MIGLLFGGLIKSALGFLKGLPWQVWAGIGALIAILFVWHVHTGWEKVSAKAAYNSGYNAMYARYDAEVKKNAINLASITEMQHNLDAKNAESDARAKAFADAKAADQKDIARLDALNRANAPRIAALQSIVSGAGHDPACKAPTVLISSLEGL